MTHSPTTQTPIALPRDAWYPIARTREVGRIPVARRVLGVPVVLYRTTAGAAVALEDRCAHRPVRLSRGRLDGDLLVAPYSGFAYRPDGRCASVPTQEKVPYGAEVQSFPVRDDGTYVWIWVGEPGFSALRLPPDTSVLRDESWHTVGGSIEVPAGLGLLLDNFCDITHVPQLDSGIAPPALTSGATPPLNVEVSETSLRFSRDYPAAPLSPWHAQLLELPEEVEHVQVETGEFAGPGYWVDGWSVHVAGHDQRDGVHTFVFSHALTPIDARRTQHLWTVSRNFALGAAGDGTLEPLFSAYYASVAETLAEMQLILDEDGPRPDVAVAADAAVTQVRRIVERMVLDERE